MPTHDCYQPSWTRTDPQAKKVKHGLIWRCSCGRRYLASMPLPDGFFLQWQQIKS